VLESTRICANTKLDPRIFPSKSNFQSSNFLKKTPSSQSPSPQSLRASNDQDWFPSFWWMPRKKKLSDVLSLDFRPLRSRCTLFAKYSLLPFASSLKLSDRWIRCRGTTNSYRRNFKLFSLLAHRRTTTKSALVVSFMRTCIRNTTT